MDAHTYIGTDLDGSPVALSLPERLRHVAIFGATGVGKSNLLRHIVQQDIDRGEGVLFIDPHGDDAERLIDNVPAHRSNHVCYFDLTDRDFPIGFNVLEDVAADDRATLAETIVSAMRSIWRESWGNRMERLLRHSGAALIETPNASLVLLPRLLTDTDFRRRIVSRVSNPITRGFFEQQYDVWRDNFRDEVIVSLLNDIEAFTFSPASRSTGALSGQGRARLGRVSGEPLTGRLQAPVTISAFTKIGSPITASLPRPRLAPPASSAGREPRRACKLDAVGRARSDNVVAAPEIVAKDMAHQKSIAWMERGQGSETLNQLRRKPFS